MGIMISEKEPQLIGVFSENEQAELANVQRMVRNMNQMLVDSGFEQYKYDVKIDNGKAYIVQV